MHRNLCRAKAAWDRTFLTKTAARLCCVLHRHMTYLAKQSWEATAMTKKRKKSKLTGSDLHLLG